MPVEWKSLPRKTPTANCSEDTSDPSGVPKSGAFILCRRVESDPAVEVPGLIPKRVGIPTVFCLQLPESSPLLKEGMPRAGFALYYHSEAHTATFENAWGDWICNDVMGDRNYCEGIRFRDDPDWRIMPEIGVVIRAAKAKGVQEVEDDCYCLAMNKDKTCWGIGLGASQVKRHPAAKLALALGMTYATAKLEEISTSYPEFGAMCAYAGFVDEIFFKPQLTPYQQEQRTLRLRQRLIEGGKAGGYNERQAVVERNEFVNDSGLDEFGRRISKPSGDQQAVAPKQLSKAERAKAALERLKQKRTVARSRSRS